MLKSIPYRETSRLVTLFTLKYGKLTVIAQGAQSLKSRFGATMQLLSHVQATIYSRPTRSIQLLSDCTHVNVYPGIANHLERLAVGQQICELVLSLTKEEQIAPEIFHLFVEVLSALNHPDLEANLIKLYFELQFSGLLGFSPAFSRESVLQIDKSGGYLVLDDGTITQEPGELSPTLHASKEVLRAFAILNRAGLREAVQLQITPNQYKHLNTLVQQFLRYHVQDAYPVRGQKVVDQILWSEKT